jgi:hypothetical protein
MTRKQVAFVLSIGAVAFACAPRNRTATDNESSTLPVTVVQASDSSGLALTVAQEGARKFEFSLEMRNAGSLTEVRFPTGHTHDFVVLDERDREVWRWSEGRLFTHALQTRQLKRGGALRYNATWDTAAPGRYRVVASLNAEAFPTAVEQEFIVR